MEEDKKVWKMKRAAAEDAAYKFRKLMDSVLDVKKCKWIIQHFFVHEDKIAAVLRALHKIEANGGNLDMKMADGRTFREWFEEISYMEYVSKFTYFADPTSMVLEMGSREVEDKSYSWQMYNPNLFIANFRNRGTFGVIDGSPRQGKTDFGCLLIEEMLKEGMQIKTNIKIEGSPPGIFQFTKITDFLRNVVQHHDYYDPDDIWVVIIDEFAQLSHKKRAMSTRVIHFEHLARIIGKLGGSLIMIVHDFEKDVPTLLQRWTTQKYRKMSKKLVLIELQGDRIKFFDYVSNIPPTNLKFITTDMAAVQFDVDMEKLWNALAEAREYDEQKEIILNFIKKEKNKVGRKLQSKKSSPEEIAMKVKEIVKNEDVSASAAIKRVAKEFGIKPSTVSSYYYRY